MPRVPQIIHNCLPADFYKQVSEFVRAQPLRYGAKSNHRDDPFGHLSWQPVDHIDRKNLGDVTDKLPLLLQNAWTLVRGKMINAGPSTTLPRLIRCYINAYTYGMDGYFHTDSDRPDETTVILYITDKWWPDWAGETVAMDGPNYWAVLPWPNRAMVIPSNMPHAARAVSRKCTEARMVLVFKSRPSRSDTFETLSQWLMTHNAYTIKHQVGSLHDHLVRVFQLLEDRGVDKSICLGGGLHSIYGTNAFKQQLLKPDAHTRAEIASTFGVTAENLVYDFSILDRPRTLDKHEGFYANKDAVRLRTNFGGELLLRIDTYQVLCLIEAANLLDQKSLDKWPNLKGLWQATEEQRTNATKRPEAGASDRPVGAAPAGP